LVDISFKNSLKTLLPTGIRKKKHTKQVVEEEEEEKN